MYFEEDYVLRMIDMMGDFLRRLGDLIDERERMGELNGMAKRECGITLDAACDLSAESLLEILPAESAFVMSELLYFHAQTSPELSEDEKERLYYSAFRLLVSLREEEDVCLARGLRMHEYLNELCPNRLTRDDHMNAAAFAFDAKRFDDMEDEIFRELDMPQNEYERACAVSDGKRLIFNALDMYDDKTLLLGGDSRDELQDAMKQLDEYLK